MPKQPSEFSHVFMYLVIKCNWRNVDPTTPKTLAPLFESSLTEDPMTAEQSKQKTSKTIEKSYIRRKCPENNFENENLPK